MIDTAKVTGRRKLRIERLEDILLEAERLAAGDVHVLGNWSPGQIFQHLALAMNGSIDGLVLPIPWHVRLMAKAIKRRVLNGTMPSGFRMPAGADAVLIPIEPISTEDGLAALRYATARMLQTTERQPHPVFGPLSRDEWDLLHCRHAEMHLSFLVLERQS